MKWRYILNLVLVFLAQQRAEIAIVIGFVLWLVAWLPTSRALAVGPPAAVLIWIALPPRPPFFEKDDD